MAVVVGLRDHRQSGWQASVMGLVLDILVSLSAEVLVSDSEKAWWTVECGSPRQLARENANHLGNLCWSRPVINRSLHGGLCLSRVGHSPRSWYWSRCDVDTERSSKLCCGLQHLLLTTTTTPLTISARRRVLQTTTTSTNVIARCCTVDND